LVLGDDDIARSFFDIGITMSRYDLKKAEAAKIYSV
jgi:hypothetical protein